MFQHLSGGRGPRHWHGGPDHRRPVPFLLRGLIRGQFVGVVRIWLNDAKERCNAVTL